MDFKRFGYICLGSAALYGCASDSAPEPEPDMETRGAFVAILGYTDKEPVTLVRTLDRLRLENYTLLFFTLYDVHPQTFSEAREMAKSHDIKIREQVWVENKEIVLSKPYEIVWFRTLSDEELERVP